MFSTVFISIDSWALSVYVLFCFSLFLSLPWEVGGGGGGGGVKGNSADLSVGIPADSLRRHWPTMREASPTRYGRTDGRTDGRTRARTDASASIRPIGFIPQ